ncbi:uncharacterized protein F5147DRAFT_802633, partial [Suillus discolor]
SAAPNEVLFARCLPYIRRDLPSVSRLCVVSGYFEMLYGEAVAAALRRPYHTRLADPDHILNHETDPTLNHEPDPTLNHEPDPTLNHEPGHIPHHGPDSATNSDLNGTMFPQPQIELDADARQPLSWALLPAKELVQRLEKLDGGDIVDCFGALPRSRRPAYAMRSKRKRCAALVQQVQQRLSHLQSLGDYMFLVDVLCVAPFAVPTTRMSMSSLVLCIEFSSILIDRLEQPIVALPERRKLHCKLVKEQSAAQLSQFNAEIVAQWPKVVPRNVVMECLRDYVDGSCWRPGVVCAVCSRQVRSINELRVDADADLSLSLDLLQLNDPFITAKCVVQTLSSEFTYQCSVLNGLMLDKTGILVCTLDSTTLNVCGQCFKSLSRAKMPCFALANKLYQGHLLAQFCDLTWVEEMVCAIYRNMAHVTRLYQSSDPAQPLVFHGNTCAHETNIVSTAEVLPRTPADINGMLMVVFVGPLKLTPQSLKTLFVMTHGLWSFLCWLCNHNHLYEHIILDEAVMNLYPEDGTVPGVADRIIY